MPTSNPPKATVGIPAIRKGNKLTTTSNNSAVPPVALTVSDPHHLPSVPKTGSDTHNQSAPPEVTVNFLTGAPDYLSPEDIAERNEVGKRRTMAEIESYFEEIRTVAKAVRGAHIYSIQPKTLREWANTLAYSLAEADKRVKYYLTQDLIGPTPPPPAFPAESKRRASRKYSMIGGPPPSTNLNGSLHQHINMFPTPVQLPQRITHSTPPLHINTPSPSLHQPVNVTKPNTPSPTGTVSPSPNLPLSKGPHSSEAIHFSQLLPAALYVVMEAITYQLQAEKGTCFVYNQQADELAAVAVAGANVPRPVTISQPLNSGSTACSVYQTGISINGQSNNHDKKNDPNLKTLSILAFPIPNMGTRKPLGVIQVVNKKRGTSMFKDEDEQKLYHYTFVLSYLLQRYPVNFLHSMFDPTHVLHSVVGFDVHGHQHNPYGDGSATDYYSGYERKQLVYKTSKSGEYIRASDIRLDDDQAVSSVGCTASISEVDEHIKQLEESWKNAVLLNVQYESDHGANLELLRRTREELRETKRQLRELTEAIESKDKQAGEYEQKYAALREELSTIVRASTARSRVLMATQSSGTQKQQLQPFKPTPPGGPATSSPHKKRNSSHITAAVLSGVLGGFV
eukprot:TRINITY_DN67960_c5_g2_i1.p1 TRINITY_DN67960_c5_g2~~TRINITY_DN67960_c5_g2_i1.p1  ORF type:complete len:635 (-),score=24.46 TRINITY_DN67960_c5_g2_i1:646-2517(-)